MKKSLLFSLLCTLLIVSCSSPTIKEIPTSENQSETKVKKEVLAENKAEVKMKVDGMVCAMGCAKFIENEVAGLDGVVLSHVDFEESAATFEFDKTTLSAEEIETFINSIHDGQYKAKIAANENVELEIENASNEEEESLSSVSERIDNISLPKLFTFLLKRLR